MPRLNFFCGCICIASHVSWQVTQEPLLKQLTARPLGVLVGNPHAKWCEDMNATANAVEH